MTHSLLLHLPALLLAGFCAPALAQKAAPDASLSGHSAAVLDVAFSPDGRRLASAGDDGKLKVWDVAAKKELFSFDGLRSSRNSVRFTPDGKSVVALGSENNVIVLDADSGRPRRSIPLPDLSGGGNAVDVSPDGKTLAVVGRGSLRLFDPATGGQKGSYEAHPGYDVSAVAFSPDGKTLATAGSDHKADLVDPATGKVLRTFPIVLTGTALAFDREGRTLFSASSGQVLESFDLTTGEERKLVDKGLPILTLCVSRDGKSLIVGGPGHGPGIVVLPEGRLREPACDSDEHVKSAAISPDGKTLAGGGNGGTVFLWKVGE